MKSATRILISTFGAIIGLMGAEHGIGEILQGNTAPAGMMILSWPQSEFFRVLGGEPAMTVIPNLLITGILAVLVSLIFLVWVVLFIERKHGGRVLMLLTIPMLLFGGGIFPPVLGLIISAAATRINAPLTWWQAHLSTGARRVLAALWPWLFGAGLLAWLSMFPGVPVLSYFLGIENDGLIFAILICMFGFLILASIASFARDIRAEKGQTASA